MGRTIVILVPGDGAIASLVSLGVTSGDRIVVEREGEGACRVAEIVGAVCEAVEPPRTGDIVSYARWFRGFYDEGGEVHTVVCDPWDMAAAVLAAAVARRRPVVHVYAGKGRLYTIDPRVFRAVEPVHLGAKAEILGLAVEHPGITIREAAEVLGKDESTVRRQLEDLVAKGLVELEGRPARIHPTPAGRLLV